LETKQIITERVLAPTQISLADYVINPYRGCGFGCLYCYAQKNKNIRKQKIKNSLGVKINAPSVLEKELKNIRPRKILLGSTVECFQEIEKKYRITKKILDILLKKQIPCLILTKSSLIKEYLEIISQNKENEIYFTLNLASQKIINILEPGSSSLNSRLDTIKEIKTKKIKLRIHMGPFIPYLSNLPEILSLLPKKIKTFNVELYHAKMGNFNALIKKVGENLPEKKEQLLDVYRSQKKYSGYAQKLKKSILQLKQKRNSNFFYLAPDFRQYYLPTANYNYKLK